MANAIEPEGLAHSIPANAAPTEDQRAFMQRRVREIDDAMSPADEPSALAEIAAVLRTMAIRGGDDGELEAVVRVYLTDLGDVPLFALTEACRAFRRGDVGNGTFAPTPAELRREALKRILPWTEERAKLGRVLAARVLEPPTSEDESRKAIALAHMAETARILREKSGPVAAQEAMPRPLTVPEANAWLDTCAASPPRLQPMSPELRRIMGLPDTPPAQEDAA